MVMKMKKLYLLFLTILVTIMLFFLFFYLIRFEEEEKTSPKVVETIRVIPINIKKAVRLIGYLKAKREAHLKAESLGIIDKIFVQEGSKVVANTLLAKFKNDEVNAEYELAKLKVELSRSRYNRQIELYKSKKVISKASLESAKRNLLESQITFQKAKKELNKTLFFAPFDGVCGVFKVSEGEAVKVNDVIVSLFDNTSLIVDIALPESIVSKISVGQIVKIQNNEGKIISVQHALDSKTYMGLARAQISPCVSCKIGSVVDVDVTVDQRNSIYGVPRESIFYRNDKPHVYLVKNNKAILTSIRVGLIGNNRIEIIDGVKDGDVVILKGLKHLWDYAPVEIFSNKEI